MLLTKSDYLLYRDCAKNAWMKIHRREIYKQMEQISAFQQMIFDGGNEVDVLARDLFPNGVMIEGRNAEANEITLSHIGNKTPVLFQPTFIKNGFSAALDILEYNPKTDSYTIYEVKSSTKVKPEHLIDITFQVNLLRMCGLKVERAVVMHLCKEYKLNGTISKTALFLKEDVTEKVEKNCDAIKEDMQHALKFLSQEKLPPGHCECIYKGRSAHCVTFSFLNPSIPKYGVHDISRIGLSKQKLTELVDDGIFDLSELPQSLSLNKDQQNQIDAHILDTTIINKKAIAEELDKLEFPLYFIDYETLAAPIPRYDGYNSYQQIPFQYSLYVLKTPTSEPELFEFLHTEKDDPSRSFVKSLKEHIGDKGSIIVWYEPFESTRNEEIAKHLPEMNDYMVSLNKRIYDLREIFVKQFYVHKDFLGKTSIKNVLPVMVPQLSYKELDIRDGGMASTAWNKLMTEDISEEEKEKIMQDLKKYCGLDAYAMYAIWKELQQLLISSDTKNIDQK